MPIKNLSEIRRLPRIAKIRLGVIVQGREHDYPQRVDWFVCPELVRQAYGEQPTTLPIMFPSSDPEVIAPQYYKCYRRTYGLVCRGDGETCRAKLDTGTGTLADRNTTDWKYEQMICEGEECPEFHEGNCKRVMSILFVLFELPGLGVYQLDTSNRSSIINANSFIYMLNSMTRGHFAMVPLKMSLLKEERQTPDGKRTISCLVFNKDDIKPIDLLKGIAGQNLLVEGTDEEEPPDDLYPPTVLDGTTVRPAAAPPATVPVPASPPADKQAKGLRPAGLPGKAKAAKAPTPTPLIDPGLLNGWKQLRDLQIETSVTDAMMRGGFRKDYPNVKIPKSALTDTPPPWVTKPMIENMFERLKKYKQSLATVKEFAADHLAARATEQIPETKAPDATETKQQDVSTANPTDQGPDNEILDF